MLSITLNEDSISRLRETSTKILKSSKVVNKPMVCNKNDSEEKRVRNKMCLPNRTLFSGIHFFPCSLWLALQWRSEKKKTLNKWTEWPERITSIFHACSFMNEFFSQSFQFESSFFTFVVNRILLPYSFTPVYRFIPPHTYSVIRVLDPMMIPLMPTLFPSESHSHIGWNRRR